MNILSDIIASKKRRLAVAVREQPLEEISRRATAVRAAAPAHALVSALNGDEGLRIIAEFKRQSPSKGLIRDDLSAETIARYYESGGAAAISVLTEEDYFGGSLADLRSVRQAVSIPILRKDFIFDEYQVYESAAAGADALLLIVAVLDDYALAHLRTVAEDELGLDALVEVHTRDEMGRAVASGARLIGVNNRNLKTFEVSLETSVALARESKRGVLLISESGLNTQADLCRLRDLGYRGFLIGESLMRAERPDLALSEFLKDQNSTPVRINC